jgi:putative nucleotidyltransferase with HDIG domain
MSTVLPAARLGSGAGLFEWESGGAHWFTSSWSLVLGHEFGAAPWTVLLSVDRATVRAPLAVFRRTFLLGVLLAVQVAFVLSHVYLRRSLTPLERLHAGTRRLAAGDFSTPVQVESGDEFGTLAESFNRMAADLRRDFVVLEALHQVDRAALSAQTPEPILLTLFSQAALLFPGERCAVAWTSGDREDSTCTLHVRAEQVEEPCRQQMRLRLAGLAHLAQGAEGRRGLATELLPRPAAEALAPGSGEVAVVPLFRGGRVAGFLAVTDPSGRKDCLGTLRQLAGQAALALGNVALMQELEAASFGALTALARAIDAASPWTAGHSERVTAGALEIGRRLGLSPEELDQLHRGGLLHDVGKLGVPAAILDKPGRLTEEELAVARSHAVLGASILSPIPAFRDVLPIVRNHHELLDGSGYPDRLAGDRIPRLVRIVTAADVFDALVSDRPYRSSWSTEQALAHLQEHASVWFDREAVDALAAAVAEGWSAGHHPVARPRGPGVGGEPRRQAGRRAVPLPAGPEVG